MGPASGPAGSEEPLQEWPVEGNGDLETGGEPDPRRNCRKCNYKKRTVVLPVALASMFLVLIILLAALCPPRVVTRSLGPALCPGLHGMSGLSAASLLNAFLLRYKGRFDHWIGLRRDPGQLWKWANGTKFNNLFPIRGGGDCAYLNNVNGVSSWRCTSERPWICTKPDAFTEAQEAAVVGGL
ncbi:unnamed protein product [Lepidochelys kempii]